MNLIGKYAKTAFIHSLLDGSLTISVYLHDSTIILIGKILQCYGETSQTVYRTVFRISTSYNVKERIYRAYNVKNVRRVTCDYR